MTLAALLVLALLGALVLLVQARKHLGRLAGHPTWGDVAAYFLPHIDQAITAAFKASEAASDAFGDRLKGIDKKPIALAIWSLIPDDVEIGPFIWHPKDHISLFQFEALLQDRFEFLVQAWDENSEKLLELLQPGLIVALPMISGTTPENFELARSRSSPAA